MLPTNKHMLGEEEHEMQSPFTNSKQSQLTSKCLVHDKMSKISTRWIREHNSVTVSKESQRD